MMLDLDQFSTSSNFAANTAGSKSFLIDLPKHYTNKNGIQLIGEKSLNYNLKPPVQLFLKWSLTQICYIRFNVQNDCGGISPSFLKQEMHESH